MILGSDVPLVIGNRYHGVKDYEAKEHPSQPFLVLREVTQADYEAAIEDSGGFLDSASRHYIRSNRCYFYDVSID